MVYFILLGVKQIIRQNFDCRGLAVAVEASYSFN